MTFVTQSLQLAGKVAELIARVRRSRGSLRGRAGGRRRRQRCRWRRWRSVLETDPHLMCGGVLISSPRIHSPSRRTPSGRHFDSVSFTPASDDMASGCHVKRVLKW